MKWNITYLLLAALTVTTTVCAIGWWHSATSPDVYASDMQSCTSKLQTEEKRVEILTDDLKRGDAIVKEVHDWAKNLITLKNDMLQEVADQCPNGRMSSPLIERLGKVETDWNDIITRANASLEERWMLHEQYGF